MCAIRTTKRNYTVWEMNKNKKGWFNRVSCFFIFLQLTSSNTNTGTTPNKYDLVILDKLDYISFDKEGSKILFNLLSDKNENGSIVITTNLVFERWDEIFKDPVLTGAVVDRLAHKAHIHNLSGESYRIKETKKLLKK